MKIAISADTSCAITRAGEVWCWGRNQFGQLGDGTTFNRHTAKPVAGLRAKSVGVGIGHVCSITAFDTVECWGSNIAGKLGFGATSSGEGCTRLDFGPPYALSPTPVEGASDVARLAVGPNHSCLIRQNASVFCWGSNLRGELGDPNYVAQCSEDIRHVKNIPNVNAIAAGNSFSCASASRGVPHCWGLNNFGQLGDGTHVDRRTPVAVIWK